MRASKKLMSNAFKFLAPLGVGLLWSCTTGPFDAAYQPAKGVPVRNFRNADPSVSSVDYSQHDKSVQDQIRKGSILIGISSHTSPNPPDAGQARLFAINKNADIAILSSYRSGLPQAAAGLGKPKPGNQSDQKTTVPSAWTTKITLLRGPAKFTPIAETKSQPAAATAQAARSTAPVAKVAQPERRKTPAPSKATEPPVTLKKAESRPPPPPPPAAIYETTKSIETTEEFKPKVIGDE